jgi:hypothetical protein
MANHRCDGTLPIGPGDVDDWIRELWLAEVRKKGSNRIETELDAEKLEPIEPFAIVHAGCRSTHAYRLRLQM